MGYIKGSVNINVSDKTTLAEFCQTRTHTTNGCESYHSKLNAEFHSTNLNILNLKEIQIDVYIKMRSVGKWRKALVEKEQFLIDNMLSLQVGFILRFKFVRQVSTQIFASVGFFKVK